MYNPTEHQQSPGWLNQLPGVHVTAFGARHVKGVAVSRWVAAVCFVIAAALLLAFGHWWGRVFFLVAAGLNGYARLPGPALEPAAGCSEERQALGVVSI